MTIAPQQEKRQSQKKNKRKFFCPPTVAGFFMQKTGGDELLKELKAPDKIVQQMTRGGAVEVNKATGGAERISARDGGRLRLPADFAFCRVLICIEFISFIPHRISSYLGTINFIRIFRVTITKRTNHCHFFLFLKQ